MKNYLNSYLFTRITNLDKNSQKQKHQMALILTPLLTKSERKSLAFFLICSPRTFQNTILLQPKRTRNLTVLSPVFSSCIIYTLFIEIPRYLEIPLIDFFENSPCEITLGIPWKKFLGIPRNFRCEFSQ